MSEVGTAFVSLIPSAKGFGKATEKQVGSEMGTTGKSVGSKFGTAMKFGAVAAVGGAVALGGFLKGAVEEAREAQKVGALTNAVIKSTGGIANVTAKDVDTLSTSISNKTGVDDEAIAAGQNMLLTFGNVRNEVGAGNDIFNQATVAATDMAAAFGGDAVSNSKMLGKALNDPTRGVSALTRVGVSFTEQQKEQITTLQESGDMLGAQKIILGELSKQTAGAAASQATAGQRLSTVWANFSESIGTALLPTIDMVLNGLSKFILFLTNDIGPGLAALNGFLAPAVAGIRNFFAALSSGSGAGSGITAIFAQVTSFIESRFLPAFQGVVSAVRGYFAVILPIVQQFVAGMRARIQPMLPLIRSVFTQIGQVIVGVMGLIRAVIQRVTAIISGIWNRWGSQIMNFAARTFRGALTIISAVLQIIRGVIKTVTSVIRGDWAGAWAGIKMILSGAWKAIKAIVSTGANVIKSLLSAAWAVVRTLAAKAWDAVKSAISAAWGRIKEAVAEGIAKIIADVRALPGKAVDALGNLGSTLYNAGADLIQGLIDGIADKIGEAVQKVQDGLAKIKGLLPGSPIKWGPLKGWNNTGPTGPGGRLVGLLAKGLSQTGPVDDAMGRLVSGVNLPRSMGSLAAVSGSGAGGGRNVFHLYDSDNVLLGTMEAVADGRIDGASALAGQKARAR